MKNQSNKKSKICDDKCLQYAIIGALKHRNIGKYPERITKIKPFIKQYE